MNLYEHEGKQLFQKYGIPIPRGIVVRRGDDVRKAYKDLGIPDVVVKVQIVSGKRGKNNGIVFCSSVEDVERAVHTMFTSDVRGQYVSSVLIEEKIDIAEEHYLSIIYNTNAKQPMMMYSTAGGMDIEDVPKEKIQEKKVSIQNAHIDGDFPYAQQLWTCFLQEDARLVEINPLVKTTDGRWIAADAKIALDDDAFYRHEDWATLEPRTMMGRLPTEREIAAKKIDEGEKYYQGTASKYIEMDGDIAVIFGGGGASIANMDALFNVGLRPANYTEYSGNPPREKVYALTKVVLSKPGIKALWLCGSVANFTNMAETFQGVVDAFDEIRPTYPIVIRRGGPFEKEGMELMRQCGERNNLNIRLFGKETSMSETAAVLAEMLRNNT